MAEIASTQRIIEAFTILSDASGEAASRAKRDFSSVDDWRNSQAWQVAIAGGGINLIPVAHLVTGVGEMLYLLHKMAWCAWGIGGLRNCVVEGKDDLQYILGLWSHAISESQVREMFDTCQKAAILERACANDARLKDALVNGAVAGQLTATVSTAGIPVTLAALSHVAVNSVTFGQIVMATSHAIPHVAAMAVTAIPHAVSVVASKGVATVTLTIAGELAGVPIAPYIGSLLANQLVAYHFAYHLGVTLQQHAAPLITKVAGQMAAKITKQAASKFVLGFVPFAGALAVGGINAWIIQGFADSADVYYRLKAEAAQN